MKTIWKNLASRVWLIVTAIVLVIAVVANVLLSTQFYNLISSVFGRGQTEIVGEETSNYDKDFETKAEALANGNQVTLETCREGFTLLKNEGGTLPLTADETKVSIFGKNSVNMAIGGSGSGGSVGATAKTIFDSLTATGFTYNQTLVDFYNDNSKSGPGRDANPTDLDSGNEVTLSEGETPQTSYTDDIWNSCEEYNDVALIVLTRIGGEGFDMPRSANGTHYLQLSQNEKDLINKVKGMDFGKVIVVLNAAATLEIADLKTDAGVDAILWTGYAGGNGMMAFGEVLRGEYKEADGTVVKFSPSGKTVDTYAADFTKNPTWENFGAALGAVSSSIGGDAYWRQANRGMSDAGIYFVDYEESIYVGYRYYETAAAEGYINYDEEVVYPFGYGLSYTNFSWELENVSEIPTVLGETTSMTFKVKVTNEGDYPGRDVVELYVTPHYNEGGVEKSHKVLIGFAKTDILAPGASETVEITVDSPYAYASYDYKGLSGQKGYVVEAGNDYQFTLSTDAHNAKDMTNAVITATVESNIYYKNDPNASENATEVKNLYTDNEDEAFNSNAQLVGELSRSDFAGTWPAYRTREEKQVGTAVTQEWVDKMKDTATSITNRPVQEDVMPTTGASNGIMLAELIGKDYDDELWDYFLDQLTVDEMATLMNKGAFHTEAIVRLGVPQATSADGPVGWCVFMGDPTVYDTCVYCCEVVLSSTWNVDRLYDMGKAVGNEGLIGNERGDGAPYTGWYAPGLNIHRSPFGGRNFEYYSEDPFLSGQMTAAVIKGAASKGVYVNMKHFALNDQETHRSTYGVMTWATEQSMREIYLKAFEVAIRTAQADYVAQANGTRVAGGAVKAMGVMSSFNRIGERATAGDYRLLTTILRGEWEFKGLVICDFNTVPHIIEKDMVYAGGDLNLEAAGLSVWNDYDKDNASDVTVLRQAAHNILYVVANSNAMRGEFIMHMATWQVVMFVIDGVLAVGFAVWGFFVIRKAFKED